MSRTASARTPYSLIAPALLVGALALPQPVAGQHAAPRTLELEMYLDLQRVSNPQISPAGRQIVYERAHVERMNDRWDSAIWVMDADGSRNRFLTDGSSPVWSSDGTRIAYLAPGDPRGMQIFVRWMDAEGATTQVTRVTERPGTVRWSPDGERLAFTMLVEDAADENPFARIRLPGKPAGASWTADPKVVTRPEWQRDGIGYFDRGHNQIFVVSADGGAPRQVTTGKFHHGAPEWTPDGRELLFSANRHEDHSYHRQRSEIHSVALATGEIRQLTDRHGPDTNPVPSPDGRLIAFTGDDWTRDAYKNLHIYVMNRDGSGARRISGTFDRRIVGRLTWAPDGSGVYFSADSEGSRNLHFAPVRGSVRPVTEGVQLLTTNSISRDGIAAGTRTSFHEPGDVVTFSLRRPAALERVTGVNDDLLAGVTLGEVEEIWYESFDGLEIQGWIIKPPHFDPSLRYPLMLVIHGGPHTMYNVGFSFEWQEHAANGYVILYTNPRGSSGYGSAFGNAIMDAYPGDDYYDLVAGVDSLVARGYIDRENKFVYGCSGGGVLTAWVIGRTDRFAAAAANCPVTNWMSWVGMADIAPNRRDRRTALSFTDYFWNDPIQYLDRSPLMLVGNVTTPTLLITGEHDIRTPMGETEQYYQALQALRVPTAMVRIRDAWHSINRIPSNFMRVQLYLREWFQMWGNRADERVADEGLEAS